MLPGEAVFLQIAKKVHILLDRDNKRQEDDTFSVSFLKEKGIRRITAHPI